MPRRAHLGVEAVCLAELTLAGCLVTNETCQPGTPLVDQYRSRGVRFGRGINIERVSPETRRTASRPNVAVLSEDSDYAGNRRFFISFHDRPVYSVGAYFGYGLEIGPDTDRTEVWMRSYDRGYALVADVTAPVEEHVESFLGVGTFGVPIYTVDVRFRNVPLEPMPEGRTGIDSRQQYQPNLACA